MPTEIEKLKARHAEELVKAELCETVRNEDLPKMLLDVKASDYVEVIKIHPHTYMADATIVMTAETLPDAITLAEKLNPIALFRSKKGGLAFVPEGCKKEKDDPDAISVGAYAYCIDGLRQHEEKKTLFFFVKAPSGRVLKFEIIVSNDPDNYRTWRTVNYPGGTRVADCTIHTKCGNWLSYDRFWSSDDQPNKFILYVGLSKSDD